jgi:hypothetical protein
MPLKKGTDNRLKIALISLVALNLLISIPRLLPGVPMAVDSTSHLYKILFMYDNLITHSYIPNWSPEWYGGIYLFKYYPPLGYQIALTTAFTGIGAVGAYKIVEVIFYIAAPITVYFLSRELSWNKFESLLAAFLFSLNPSIIENLLFYDRYPNIITLPLLCLLLIAIARTSKRKGYRNIFFPSILLASLTLIHHLSAAYSILILLILFTANIRHQTKRSGLIIATTIGAGMLISMFWVGPFASSISQLTENPFYNRNVIDTAYMKLTYFTTNMVTYSFGVIHFILAMMALYFYVRKKKLPLALTGFFYGSLIVGLGIFETSLTKAVVPLQTISQIIVALGFLSILYVILKLKIDTGTRFTALWFIVFLWLSLGGFAVPFSTIKAIPYIEVKPIQTLWMSLDVQRFWLFMAVPISMLAAKSLTPIIKKLKKKINAKNIICVVFISIIVAGAGIKAYYSLTQPINEYMPRTYTSANTNVPQPIIDYFKSENRSGRLLCIKCPFWIYILPRYVNKQLIDGWYPQGKILPRILDVNDYRLNDLEATENQQRIPEWKGLIEDAEKLAVNWIMIGDKNQSFQQILMEGSNFQEDAVIKHSQGEITIYKSTSPYPMIETIPPSNVSMKHLTPDLIQIQLSQPENVDFVKVKEAYSPCWTAGHADQELTVSKGNEGYIVIEIRPGVKEFYLYQRQEGFTAYDSISVITLIALSITYLLGWMRGKKWIP